MGAVYSGQRESRKNRYNDAIGTSQALTENFKTGCFKRANRSFSQGLQCQQINSVAAMLTIENSVMILHSPQGCAGCASTAADSYRTDQAKRGNKHIKNPRILCTNLDKKSIVFGGEKKLRETAKLAVENYNPEIVFVFTSCSSGIIGEDVDTISEDLSLEYGIQFVPIHCEGFKSKICASGYDAALIAIEKYILKGEKREKNDKLVNLFVPTTISYDDELEMTRLINLLGYETNVVPFFSNLEKLKSITGAVASTSMCKVFADEFMIWLDEEYGIPYSHTVMPIGIQNTDKWFLGIAKTLGKEKEALEIIEEEHKKIAPLLADIKDRLSGKKVFVCGGTGRSFACAALSEDFGMNLIGIETPTYDQDAQDDIDRLKLDKKDIVVDVGFIQPFEMVNILNKLKPDGFLGMPDWASRLGIPTSYALDEDNPTFGYNGLLYLGNKIADELTNPGFNEKIAAHSHLPYREEWLKEDAFKYIEEGR